MASQFTAEEEEILASTHLPDAVRVARACAWGGNHHLADSAAGLAVVQAIRSYDPTRGPDLAMWIRIAVRRQVRRDLRAMRRARLRFDSQLLEQVAARADAPEGLELFEEIVATLSQEDRDLVRSMVVDGVSPEETALSLGVPVWRAHLAMHRFKLVANGYRGPALRRLRMSFGVPRAARQQAPLCHPDPQQEIALP